MMSVVTRDELVIAIVYLTVAKLVYHQMLKQLNELDPIEQLIIDSAKEVRPGFLAMWMAITVAIWPSLFLVGILKLIFTPIPPRDKE